MAKKFSDLRSKLSPEVQERAKQRTQQMLADLPLHALRKARELSQTTMAEMLGATQPQISKVERRADLYVSTLRKYIEALGGQLEIVATFPEGCIRVNLFQELGPAAGMSPIGAESTFATAKQFVFTGVESASAVSFAMPTVAEALATVTAQLGSVTLVGTASVESIESKAIAADTQLALAA